jgi:membrane protease YdiL (CAAX protease family)
MITATKPKWLASVAPAWVLGAGTVVAVRYRGKWDAYVSLHRWCSELGVPDSIRQFDSLILYAMAALLGSLIATRWLGCTVTGNLGLRRGVAGWKSMLPVALLPMVAGGVILGMVRNGLLTDFEKLWPKLISGVVRAPVAEELLFRGLLVGVCAAWCGWRGVRFWCNATAAAMLFAAIHVEWKAGAVQNGWPTLLVTGAGGLWYAWLLSRWHSLWVPLGLHAGMNLGWMLAGAGGGAGGGGWMENLLRVGTIAIATFWTVRRTSAAVPLHQAGAE